MATELLHNGRMVFCEAPPLILFLHGDLAITTRSLPSVLAVPIYLLVCLVLCIRRRTIGLVDPLIVFGLVAGQLAVLKDPKMSHPFFWAPFNLIGNWRLTVGGAT